MDAVAEPYDANPVYTYSYQVADPESQTFINKEENRADNVVTGTYSYVDPNGSLVTVTYTADENGYSEERTVEANFLRINEAPAPAPVVVPAPTPAPVRRVVVRPRPAPVAPAAPNTDDLVARLVAQLTPFVRTTVSNSLNGN